MPLKPGLFCSLHDQHSCSSLLKSFLMSLTQDKLLPPCTAWHLQGTRRAFSHPQSSWLGQKHHPGHQYLCQQHTLSHGQSGLCSTRDTLVTQPVTAIRHWQGWLHARSRQQRTGSGYQQAVIRLPWAKGTFVQKDPGKEKNEQTDKRRGAEEEHLLQWVMVMFIVVETPKSAKRS